MLLPRLRYDKHVVPNERVTDFRTFVSGVKPKDLRGGLSLRKCQDEVAAILDGKVLVGHALKNDLAVRRGSVHKLDSLSMTNVQHATTQGWSLQLQMQC